jgi:ectoine hydroxylase-related dioxygenase (phytanoyl-CoA dioxygenase family)
MAVRKRDGRATLAADRRAAFETEGYLVIPEALAPDLVEDLTAAVDRVYAERAERGAPFHLLAFIREDPVFLDLLDLPATLPLVADVLGPNIYCYHCHLDVHPPEPADPSPKWMWHQDGGVQNRDIESDPRPRLSVKLAYFLTDLSEPGRGNFVVLPGSHLRNRIERPADDSNDLPGAVPVLARPGDAVMFDRRLWHMRSRNASGLTRKALFLAYTYRWVRPRDDMPTPSGFAPFLTPVREQLLGNGARTIDFWMPDLVEPPVAAWLRSTSPPP